MRFSQSLKSLLRTPFKTIITFLLIAAASFALFSRVTDYAVTAREMNRALNYYNGVASLDTGTPYTTGNLYKQNYLIHRAQYESVYGITPPPALDRNLIEAFSALPGVTAAETRVMTGGVIEGYRRFYNTFDYDYNYDSWWMNGFHQYYSERVIYGYDYTARYIMEGTYTGTYSSSLTTFSLAFEDCVLIAGEYPVSSDGSVGLHRYYNRSGAPVHIGYALNTPGAESYFNFITRLDGKEPVWDGMYDSAQVDMLTEGERYVFYGRYPVDFPSWNWLGNADTAIFGPHVLPASEFERADYQEIIDIIDKDINTFDIVYTSNMYAIPRVNENRMVLSNGRFLTPEDDGSNVCVVSNLFLERYGLNIGDTLTIGLGDRLFEQHSGDGAITYLPERQWNIAETVELEIVGAYEDVDPPYQRDAAMYWGYHPCTVFVPMSLLPIEIPAEHTVKPGEFSLFIGDARDIDAFLEQAEPLAEQMGIVLRFSDRGWANVKDNMNISQTVALLTAVFYALAASAALLLSVYLYIGRNKKTYAIMRALGVARKNANKMLALPFGALAVLAVPAGGIFGIYYASNTISTNQQMLAEAGFSDASLPIAAIVVCFICEALLIAFFTSLFLRKMAKTPPLVLLQGDVIAVNAVRDMQIQPRAGQTMEKVIQFTPALSARPRKGKYSAFRHVTAYIFKHMRRVKLKTAIALALAIMLTGAMGFLAITRMAYQEMFNEVDVTYAMADFSSSAVTAIENSELTENLYYYSNYSVSLNASSVSSNLIFTNDLERSFPNVGYTIDYADGFSDLSFLNENAANCLVGSEAAERLGLQPGDRINMMSNQRVQKYYADFADGVYMLRFPELERLVEFIIRESVTYTVAGVIESDIRNINTSILASLGGAARRINPTPFTVTHMEFIVTDNEKLHEIEEFLDELQFTSRQYASSASYRVDTTEIDNIKRVRDLLILLFPVAVIAVILIGLTAPALLIIQSSKEAAILRVLGATKKRVRCILMFEQIALCVAGVILAAGGLILYNSGLFARSAETLALCGVLYVLGCVCAVYGASVSVTQRRILELLQVKE